MKMDSSEDESVPDIPNGNASTQPAINVRSSEAYASIRSSAVSEAPSELVIENTPRRNVQIKQARCRVDGI